jgi:hypothetical protein
MRWDVRVGDRHPMDEGEIEIDSIEFVPRERRP